MRRVNPKVYTKKYYLTDCTGYKEFQESQGDKLEPRFKEIIKFLTSVKGKRVLDIGCGRGEMVLYCAKKGAIATGIDYSKEAIVLAKSIQKKKSKNIQKKTNFFVMDGKKLKFKDSFFDLVILTDVAEHLYSEELDIMFEEIKRVLKENGKLIVHTAPNKWFNDFGYRYYSYPLSTVLVFFWNLLFKGSYPNIARPKDLRTDSHAVMHINEPTYFSLKNLYKTHDFYGSIRSTNVTAKKPIISVKDTLFNLIVFLHPISTIFPFNIVFGSDFISLTTNRK